MFILKEFLCTSDFLLMVGHYSSLKYLSNANEGVNVNAAHLVHRGIKYFNLTLCSVIFCLAPSWTNLFPFWTKFSNYCETRETNYLPYVIIMEIR